jgi:3',5'-cyclic AMP phosphodiesterase CpdA
MTATRVLVISDSHLSSRTPEALANWDAVVAHIAHDEPDLVIHAGDVSTDGAHVGDDLAFAGAQLERIELPTYVLPGNHDLGDNPHAGTRLDGGAGDSAGDGDGGGGHEPLVDAARLARYRAHLPPDRWTVDIPGWRLIGLNALLFDSGLDDEDAQWRWLDDQLGSVGRRQRVGVFVHKPVVAAPARPDDSAATSPWRYVPPAARDRILAIGARLVVSGHIHQFCRHRTDGATHVWAPSTWAVIPDRFQPTIGDKVCGVVELVLHDDGICETELMLPYGIVQQAIVDDIADPYV